MKLSLINVVKSALLIVSIFAANISSNHVETKSESGITNRSIDLSTMVMKLEEDIRNDIYSAKDTYTGSLTGYAADCELCTGKLACASDYYVLDGTDTYDDETYGQIKIVASSKNLACGTVIRFESSLSTEPIIAIVLDRGVLGSDIDLLTPSEEYANQYVGRKTITYDVLRQGWD